MFFYLFLLFIVLPLAEIVILVQIGMLTEWWVPIAIVLLTGIVGSALARWQGWKVLERIRTDMSSGRVPADSLIDGFLVLVAGVLFVLPGVVTDVVAICLLIPPVRAWGKRLAAAWFKRRIELRVGPIDGAMWPDDDGARRQGQDRIIDAKVIGTRVEDANRRRD